MSTSKAGKRPLRTLTPHEKLHAIKRVSVGGESKASVARDIGVPESTLRGWCKNQEKISYQVRTSPNNLDDTPENLNMVPAKKRKLEDQPFNLSTKGSDCSNTSHSPRSENHYDGENDLENSPLNLRTKPDTSTPVSANKLNASQTTPTDNKDRDRERVRAELARISEELGLNRPEVMSNLNKLPSNQNDLTTLLYQWNTIYQQQMYLRAMQQQPQQQLINTVSTSADNKIPFAGNGLLTTVDKRDKILPNSEPLSAYDTVTYWLRQQSLMGLIPPRTQQSMVSVSTTLPSTSSISNSTSTTSVNIKNQQSSLNLSTSLSNAATLSNATPVANQLVSSSAQQSAMNLLTTCQQSISSPPCSTNTTENSPTNNLSHAQSANKKQKFWNWFNQTTSDTPQPDQQPMISPEEPDKPILYQQLTKEDRDKEESNVENLEANEDKPKNSNRNRSVLDNLMLNNNTIKNDDGKDEEPLTAQEAIIHGEKFLQWFETYRDPSVTTTQIVTLRTVIKNLKAGVDRKNGDCQSKTKVKRK